MPAAVWITAQPERRLDLGGRSDDIRETPHGPITMKHSDLATPRLLRSFLHGNSEDFRPRQLLLPQRHVLHGRAERDLVSADAGVPGTAELELGFHSYLDAMAPVMVHSRLGLRQPTPYPTEGSLPSLA